MHDFGVAHYRRLLVRSRGRALAAEHQLRIPPEPVKVARSGVAQQAADRERDDDRRERHGEEDELPCEQDSDHRFVRVATVEGVEHSDTNRRDHCSDDKGGADLRDLETDDIRPREGSTGWSAPPDAISRRLGDSMPSNRSIVRRRPRAARRNAPWMPWRTVRSRTVTFQSADASASEVRRPAREPPTTTALPDKPSWTGACSRLLSGPMEDDECIAPSTVCLGLQEREWPSVPPSSRLRDATRRSLHVDGPANVSVH